MFSTIKAVDKQYNEDLNIYVESQVEFPNSIYLDDLLELDKHIQWVEKDEVRRVLTGTDKVPVNMYICKKTGLNQQRIRTWLRFNECNTKVVFNPEDADVILAKENYLKTEVNPTRVLHAYTKPKDAAQEDSIQFLSSRTSVLRVQQDGHYLANGKVTYRAHNVVSFNRLDDKIQANILAIEEGVNAGKLFISVETMEATLASESLNKDQFEIMLEQLDNPAEHEILMSALLNIDFDKAGPYLILLKMKGLQNILIPKTFYSNLNQKIRDLSAFNLSGIELVKEIKDLFEFIETEVVDKYPEIDCSEYLPYFEQMVDDHIMSEVNTKKFDARIRLVPIKRIDAEDFFQKKVLKTF